MVKKYSPEVKRKALGLLKSGYKPKKVSATLDIPIGTLYRWLSEERKREEEESGALVQGQPSEMAQELQAQIGEVLEEIKLGIAKVSVKSTADLKNLGTLFSQLCRASEQLNIPIIGEIMKSQREIQKEILSKFMGTLSARELKIIHTVSGDEEMPSTRLDDITQEEIESLIEKVKTSNLHGVDIIIAKLRSWKKEEEANQKGPTGEK